jgi:hypothetical protein
MSLKRLVTSAAAIAILGCSDSVNEGTPPPPFVGLPLQPPVTQPVNTPGAGQQTPPASGAGAPTNGQTPSEGQNPNNIGIANPQGSGAAPGGSEPSTDMAAGTQPASGMEQPSTEGPPTAQEPPAQEPPAQEPPAEPEPVPEPEPEPIIRPALNCGAPAPALQGGGIQGCQAEDQGSVAGQNWFLWYTGGNGCMTTHENLSGAFTAQWNNPGDFLARLGFWFDETQTFEELGELGADLRFTRQGSAGGFSFIGIYGWTVDPLVEYYIVEDSFGNGPAQPFNTQMRGNFDMDGARYNIYSGARQNLPSIIGNADFTQVLSVRQTPRQCGHVSISEHFRQWQRMGLPLGLAKEAKVLVEAGGGNGSITFTHANVTVTPRE